MTTFNEIKNALLENSIGKVFLDNGIGPVPIRGAIKTLPDGDTWIIPMSGVNFKLSENAQLTVLP